MALSALFTLKRVVNLNDTKIKRKNKYRSTVNVKKKKKVVSAALRRTI